MKADVMAWGAGLLEKDAVSPEDRSRLAAEIERAGGLTSPTGGYLFGVQKTIGQRDREKADAMLAASLARQEEERRQKERQRVERWNALPALEKAAFMLHARDHDDVTQKLLALVQLAQMDLTSVEPAPTFEPGPFGMMTAYRW